MNDIKLPVGNLYVGEGVVASGIAIVPGSAVVNGRFDGAIEAKEIDIQGNGELSGTTQAASITVTGKLNDVVQAADLLAIGSTGVVTGDVRYGNLEVAKGGELLGSMKRM
jgi:cytoskeletal protein CcmA (bactofilin family)